MKNIVILAVIVVGGILAWQNFPGLRTKITNAANKYGGWSQEDREKDPIGFLNHAKDELASNISKFEGVQGDLNKMKVDAEAKLEKFRNDQQLATDLTNEAKELYNSTETADSWPLTWNGDEYSRDDLRKQLKTLLAEKGNAAERQTEYSAVLNTIDERKDELRVRIADSKAAIDKLTSQEAQLKVAQLSDSSTELLAQVNELVEGNSKIAADPVRSLEDLAKASAKEAGKDAENEAKSVEDTELDAFLKG